MRKNTLAISLSVLLFVASSGLPSWSATAAQKQQLKKLKQKQKQLQQQMSGQSDQANLQPPEQGRMDSNPGSSGGSTESISMFKAGNTTLPAGTYAMTNVSTGAAFVVIVDDSGDMRAQDARAMKLIDDSKVGSDNQYRGGGSDHVTAGNQYGGGNSYGGTSYGGGGYQNSQPPNQSAAASPPTLSPAAVPSSAVLPAQGSQHPLLQGMSAQGAYPQQPKQGGIQGLLNQLNPQGAPGQPGAGGIQGKIQAELQRQLNKQLLKGGTGGLEQQVRKMIQSF